MFCVELITSGQDVKPIGTNPRIGLGAGVFDIISPDVPVVQCNASTTFNFRTTTTQETLTVLVELRLRDDFGRLSNHSIATTNLQIRSELYSETQPVCITLLCADPEVVGLPDVAVVHLTVSVIDGTAEFSNVNFVDGKPCDGKCTQ